MSDASTGPVKVLVIDDSNTIRRSAELFLRQAGFEVILAEDGFDALSKITDHEPQVIFDGPPSELDRTKDRRVQQFVHGEAGERLTGVPNATVAWSTAWASSRTMTPASWT